MMGMRGVVAVRRVKVKGSRSYHLAPLNSHLAICGSVALGPMTLRADRSLCARCGLALRAANRETEILKVEA